MADAPVTAAPPVSAGDGAPPAAAHGGAIEVDDETDSTFGDDASDTTSLTSSIFHHKHENGRTYHAYKAGKYMMPNDEEEMDRLDIHHHISMLNLGGEHYLAPIGSNPDRILDVGTGTGVWAIDIGEKFPNATIKGIDLSPSQPSMVPPNVQFEIDDMEEDWTFSQPFDFIHARYLAGSVYNWEKLVRQCFDNLKPGGWVEFKDWDVRPHDASGSLDIPDNYVKKWHDEVIGACTELGVATSPGLFIKDLVTAAGFTNINETVYEVPAGGWPKDKQKKLIGKFYWVTLNEGALGISLRVLTQVRGWSAAEVNVLNAKFREDMKIFPYYHKYHVIYAQKPPKAATSSS